MFADTIKRALAPELARKKSQELQEAAARKTDAMRRHEYMVARRSILGELSAMPVTASQKCITNAKAARRRERMDLVNSEVVACPRHAAQAARLRRNMDEVENMRCAKHVYLANDPDAPPELRDNPPPGFLKPTAEQIEKMGLTEQMLTPEGSEFKAAMYIKDSAVWGPSPKPPAVMALRGSTPADEDWQNNFFQDANEEAPYYRNAVLIGNSLANSNANVHIVGHSLGGGLASAAQGGSGLTASTYNAAGLHPATVARYSKDVRHVAAEPEKITAIRIKGEVLTATQENLFQSRGLSLLANSAVGMKEDILPSHDKEYLHQLKHAKKINVKEQYATYLHGMDEVIDSVERQKKDDESVLRNCLGHRRKK